MMTINSILLFSVSLLSSVIQVTVSSVYCPAGVSWTANRKRHAIAPRQSNCFEIHVLLSSITFVSEVHLQCNLQACTNAKICENKELVAYYVL